MKSVEGVCRELRSLDGVVGAFLLRKSRCVASSLPPQYDFNRLSQVADVLARISQMSQKAGYGNCAMTFHWQRASLMSWPLADGAVLGLLASPNAVRESIHMSVEVALEDLSTVPETEVSEDVGAPTSGREANAIAAPAVGKSASDLPMLEERLRAIERLLVEELGPSGKTLLERCRGKTPKGKGTTSDWLLALRQTVVGEVAEPGARVAVGTSYLWTGLD